MSGCDGGVLETSTDGVIIVDDARIETAGSCVGSFDDGFEIGTRGAWLVAIGWLPWRISAVGAENPP